MPTDENEKYRGKLLSTARKIAKLTKTLEKGSSTFGKPLFDSAYVQIKGALDLGALVLLQACHLSYNDVDAKRAKEFAQTLRDFESRREQALRALDHAQQHAFRTGKESK